MNNLNIALPKRKTKIKTIAPGVGYMRIVMVNVYFVSSISDPDKWILVDCGMGPCSAQIKNAAKEYFGDDTAPSAIILTHGHFDHVGALPDLAREWNIPVYAHKMEMPYLTGKSSYPPPDPTVGKGIMPLFSPLFKRTPIDLGQQIQELKENDTIPGFPEWKIIYTPGHSPGHISLFRDYDRTLIVGDAFVTVQQESAFAIITQKQEVNPPPAYFTIDWYSSEKSLRKLAELKPEVAGTGHGIPMKGIVLRFQLDNLVKNFNEVAVPNQGRYVHQPVIANENGIVAIPKKVDNPYYKMIFSAALITLAGIAIYKAVDASRQQSY
ncbi:MAG TPA: MBL fold metallo-hydrolase [Cytophagales bacterium]|nr:MBL fold metallo-hydrolase [Cytophagales bacterium]